MRVGMPRSFDRAWVLALAVGGLALAGAGAAEAAPILQADMPNATYTNYVNGGIINGASDGHATGQPTNGISVAGSSDGLGTPPLYSASTSNDYTIPRISVLAQADDGATAHAQSALTYYVAFSGDDGTIPVTIQASGTADSTGGEAFLQLEFQKVENGVDEVFKQIDITGGNALLSLNQTYMLAANTLYRVIMDAEGTSTGHGGAASGTLDPFFSAPTGYSVLTSAGIGNASPIAATPIPAALPLLTAALVGLGLLGWHRRTYAAA